VTDLVDTDVLVIGGGAAGANAALKAADKGARVLMIVKGLLGRSGCSIFGSHLPYHDVSTVEKDRDRFRYSVRYYNHYLTDQEYVKRMGQYMRTEFFPELERLGVYWRRTDDGKLVTGSDRVPVLVAHKQGASGVIIMSKRRHEILARGVPVREETAATSLLVHDGRVVGATALDYRRGEFFAVRAKSTILASGHSDYLATRSTGTREQSADGIAMALRAGAELANLEIQWWHASDLKEPRAWMRVHIYPNPLLGTKETARLYNARGEVFYEQATHSPGSSAPYVEQMRRLALEVEAGAARWDGGYFSGYDHIPAEVIKTYQHQAKVWSKLGLDVGRERLECGVTWHMRQGGIEVDPQRMQSTLPGLYVAGGIGAHYLGGLGPVSYDGKVAGTAAAESARSSAQPPQPREAIRREEERVFGLLRTGSKGPLPIELKVRIREIMWELGYVKNERKLLAALEALQSLREERVSQLRLRTTSKTWNSGWLDALDVYSMLDACEATIRSGLHRKESRGPFYREDYPYVDNENWLCKVIVSRRDGQWQWRTEPYALPYLGPERSREPFFEADY